MCRMRSLMADANIPDLASDPEKNLLMVRSSPLRIKLRVSSLILVLGAREVPSGLDGRAS